MADMYIPDTVEDSNEAMNRWYANISNEMADDFLTPAEKTYMGNYYHEAGLLQWWRLPFFRRHFVESFTDAARYLLGASVEGTIVDLGCGTGTQSLVFAMRGAKVVGLDMDTVGLGIFRKRQAYYEQKMGRPLDIEIREGNVFDMNFADLGPIKGVYSMFAFNMMQPSGDLLDRITRSMKPGSRLVVLDGNSRSLLARYWPGRRRHVWSPGEFASELKARSIEVESQVGGVAIAPQLWRMFPYGVMRALDRALCGNMVLPISHQVSGQMANAGTRDSGH